MILKPILSILFISSTFCTYLLSQAPVNIKATAAGKRIQSFQQRKALADKSIVNTVEFESIGPTVFSGRVSDIDVSPLDPTHFYVAYASGGLWKTTNNGMSFEPLFDHEMVMTVGDFAVDWKSNTIWLGSGEVNSSRSSYAGTGIFKSADGGKTWQHVGLGESHHIGRIILHPTDPNTIWVAVLGHLYTPNEERGVYKTTDGGKTWQKTLFVDENSGAVDLIIDPDNPQELYAATWHRERRSWNFVESGNGSGIYKSIDGGNTWTLLSTENSGFPTGEGVGRVGLDIFKKDGKTILYAALDNYFRRPEEQPKQDVLTKKDLRGMSKEDFLQLERYKIKDFITQNRFPKEYDIDKVLGMIKQEEITPLALVEYVEDANSLLFDTPVIGLEIYRSEDGGNEWTKTNEDYIDAVYNSYGYYFGQVRIAPQDPNKIYCLGVPVIRSDDGGKTFKSINGDNVHSDHHALWINPNRPGHLILGNDGGINISYDDGEHWNKCNTPSVGQFYYIAVDHAKPYNVYGGLQDNGVWMGANTYKVGSTRWHGSGQYPWKSIMGGDGMQVAVDTRNNQTVYTGFQFGNYFRINTKTNQRDYITPKHKLGERPLRWNWQAPIHLSTHNQDILYMGSNKLHRSFNQGSDFEEISEDLTTGGKKGDVAFSTLTTIHESPFKFGLLYVGSDDGLVHISKDAGATWQNITSGLPQNKWVSRIIASQYDEAKVFVVLNGYRDDDFTPYVFVSNDYGQNWQAIAKDLPLESVNVIKEDPKNPSILYFGTDHGLYVSLDEGQSVMLMNNKLPAVPVHDVVIHPDAQDILVGTHGRSIYKASAKELQQLNDTLLKKEIYAFSPRNSRYSSRWGNSRANWMEPNSPSVALPMYSNQAGEGNITVKHGDLSLQTFSTELKKGLNYINYDLAINQEALEAYHKALNKKQKKDEKPIKLEEADNGKIYLYKGKYTILIEKNGAMSEAEMVIK